MFQKKLLILYKVYIKYFKKLIQWVMYRYDCTNCTPPLLFYMAKDSFSLQVEPRLRSLKEESFPLPYTGAVRPIS